MEPINNEAGACVRIAKRIGFKAAADVYKYAYELMLDQVPYEGWSAQECREAVLAAMKREEVTA